MSNTSFRFATHFCCPLVLLKVTQHHAWAWVNNKSSRVKGRHWRWLIYCLRNFLLHDNMLRVFRSNHPFSWKFHKFYRKTPVLESLFSLKIMELYKEICSAWISHISHIFLIDWSHKHLKNLIDLLVFYGEHFYGFSESDLWKRWKKKHFIKNISIYTVTDNFNFCEVLFCTYCKGLAFELSSQSSFAITSREKQGL